MPDILPQNSRTKLARMRDAPPSRAGRLIGPSVLAAIFASLASTALAAEGMAVASPALGMAVTPPDPGMAEGGTAPPSPEAPRVATPEHSPVLEVSPPRRPRAFGGVAAGADGRLPNQRTGHHHEHVVRDICIGC
ncbi:hypothetical protein KHHGKMAE_3169 [Methylobacterium persicinum]|nr:hypothetical protein KHHGKMAE_3169 [Methylobacterium persicinum]